MHDRSSRPHRTPTRTPVEVEQRILQLRQRERRGPEWIGAEIGVSPRTVSRVLARNAVPRLDDHSRLAYCEILPDEKGATCAGFLTRGLGYFAVHGITTIEQLMTDNAWAYRWSLREHCAAAGINQIFIRPHCPWQNGKVERLNRTLLNEWAYRQVFLTNDDRTAALAPWIERYKHSTTSQRTRRTPTDQPTATNLMARYT